MHTFESLAALEQAAGSHLGHSQWVAIEQERVNTFAEVTGDLQWIHVDPERAVHGPFGTAVAHGYLILSMMSTMAAKVYQVGGVAATVNYGLEKVRFPAPVPVGSRVRTGVEVVSVQQASAGATHATIRLTAEVEGGERPACVADTVRRFVPAGGAGHG